MEESMLFNSLFVPANVNLAISKVFSICSLSLYLGFLLRIFVGPFPYAVVVAYHYGTRVTSVSFLSMLTFKIVLKTCFIIDFDRMSAIAEKRVMKLMVLSTSIFTIAHIVEEAVLRQSRGLNHFARWCFNIYLGKVRSS